jgi:DNA polymerase-3 subunit epsilon
VLLDTLVKPVGSIHPDAQAVHSIEDALLQDAPRWNQIWPEIEDILSNRLVGVYNADFDLRMMQQSHSRNWLSWCPPKGMQLFCIMKLYAQFYGQWDSRRSSYRWHSLESAGRQCGIPLPNSHRAKEDAKLTGAVLEYIADQQG